MALSMASSKRWVVITGLVLVCLLCGTVSAAFTGLGNGSASNPYQITTYTQLTEINASASSYYKLMNDISGAGATYSPIVAFSGQLDGNNKTLSDMIMGNYGTIWGMVATTSGTPLIKNVLFFNNTVKPTATFTRAGLIYGYCTVNSASSNILKNVFVANTTFNASIGSSDPYAFGMFVGDGQTCHATIDNSSILNGMIRGFNHNYNSYGVVAGGGNQVCLIHLTDVYSAMTPTNWGKTSGIAISYAGGGTYTNTFIDSTLGTGFTSEFYGGTLKTTAQMKTQNNYTSWDFTNTWKMSTSNGIYQGYPVFQWMEAPVAAFTKTGTGGFVPYTFSVNDTSTNTPTSWLYVVSDGQTATTNNATFTMSTVGVFTVNLTATSAGGSNTSATQQITVSGVPPVAAFTATDSASYVYPLKVQYNDTSTGTPTSWEWTWTFGDGRSSIIQNPVYSYTVANNYTVSLNVTNAYGSNTTSHHQNLFADDDIYLMSWLHFNTTPLLDLKGNAWSLHGATVSATQSKWGGTSLYLSSNNNYASSPSSNKYDFGSGDFSIEFWLYPTTLDGEQNLVSRTTGLGAGEASGWAFNNNGTVDGYSFWMGSLANASTRFSLTSDAWHHIVVTRVSGTIEIFRDGVIVSTKSQPGNYDTGNSLVFGTSEPGTEDDFYLDEFRITAGYPRFTTNFDTPYAEYRGNLIGAYINIQPDATLRYKTDTGIPNYPQIFNHTPRHRTVQIQNVVNATRINVSVFYSPDIILPTGVQLNTTDFNDIILDYYEIDPAQGVVRFSVSKAAGIKGIGDQRVNLVDIPMVYYGYSALPYVDTYFVYGSTTDGEHGVSYPIVYFIDTPVYLVWITMSNFTVSNTAPLVNVDTVNFASEMNQTANRFYWDFGDGTNDLTTNGLGTHQYTTTGYKTVSLTAYLSQNNSVTNTTTKTNVIYVGSTPAASFTKSHTIALVGQSVNYTSTSSGLPAISYYWVASDGQTSVLENPSFSFASPGIYGVNLTVQNVHGSSTAAVQDVDIGDLPFASFNKSTDVGVAPLGVQFNFTGSGATSYAWEFDDGDSTNATQENPYHTFDNVGTYHVFVEATNTYGSVISGYQTITVGAVPIAFFAYLPNLGLSPVWVQFTDMSGGTPTSWNWSFGDGTYSTLQDPLHQYSTALVSEYYAVCLTATNDYGTSYHNIPDAVHLTNPPLTADFYAIPVSGSAPLNVQFFSTTTPWVVDEYTWDFGDGMPHSHDISPTHMYMSNGYYTVILTVDNYVYGGDVETKVDYIRLELPEPQGNATVSGNVTISGDCYACPSQTIIQAAALLIMFLAVLALAMWRKDIIYALLTMTLAGMMMLMPVLNLTVAGTGFNLGQLALIVSIYELFIAVYWILLKNRYT